LVSPVERTKIKPALSADMIFSSSPLPAIARRHPEIDGMAEQLGPSLNGRAEPLRDAPRTDIVGLDAMNDAIDGQIVEHPPEGASVA
jgi:hypothetical protein